MVSFEPHSRWEPMFKHQIDVRGSCALKVIYLASIQAGPTKQAESWNQSDR